MADLRIEKDKAEPLVALLLREKKMSPAEAGAFAITICNRLQAAMAMPTKPGLRGYKMILEHPPYEIRPEFMADLGSHVTNVDEYFASTLWEIVYKYGRNIPDDVVI